MAFIDDLKIEYSHQSKIFTESYRNILKIAASERKLYVLLEMNSLEDLVSVAHTLSKEGFTVEYDCNCEITGNFNLKVYIV